MCSNDAARADSRDSLDALSAACVLRARECSERCQGRGGKSECDGHTLSSIACLVLKCSSSDWPLLRGTSDRGGLRSDETIRGSVHGFPLPAELQPPSAQAEFICTFSRTQGTCNRTVNCAVQETPVISGITSDWNHCSTGHQI